MSPATVTKLADFRWEGTGECDAVGEIGCDVLGSRFTTVGS